MAGYRQARAYKDYTSNPSSFFILCFSRLHYEIAGNSFDSQENDVGMGLLV